MESFKKNVSDIIVVAGLLVNTIEPVLLSRTSQLTREKNFNIRQKEENRLNCLNSPWDDANLIGEIS